MWMLVLLMLSQRSLELLSFKKSFFYSASVIFTSLSSSLLIHSSVSSNLLLIPSSVFFLSVILFFISMWFFFRFSNSLLEMSDFSLCSSYLKLLIIFTIITYNSSSSRFLICTSLSSSSWVLSHFFIWNISLCCLILPNSLFLFLYIW